MPSMYPRIHECQSAHMQLHARDHRLPGPRDETSLRMKTLLKPANLTQRVYDHLKEMIQAGEFSTDEPMFETQLASDIGVSRTPVREALKMLEIEGYLEPVYGGGVRAFPLKPRDLSDVLQARIALEQVTTRLAAQRSDEAAMALLDDVLLKTERAIEAGLLADILAQNERFHRVIAALTGTRFLEQTVDRIYDYVKTHRLNRHFGAGLGTRPTVELIYQEHVAIAEAIRARDADLAERLMREHLEEVGRRYVSSLEARTTPAAEAAGS